MYVAIIIVSQHGVPIAVDSSTSVANPRSTAAAAAAATDRVRPRDRKGRELRQRKRWRNADRRQSYSDDQIRTGSRQSEDFEQCVSSLLSVNCYND